MKKTDQIIADKVLSRQISLMRFSAGEKKKVLDLFLQMQAELKMKLANGFTSYEKERITKLLRECTAIIEDFYGKMIPSVGVGLGDDRIAFLDNLLEKAKAEGVAGRIAINKLPTIEQQYLVSKGAVFDVDRMGKPLLGYSQKQRIADLRAKVSGKLPDQSTDLLGLAKAEAAATQTAIASIGLEASLPTAAVLKAMVSDTLLQGAPLSAWWAKQSSDTAFKFSAQVRQGVAQGETLQQVITRIVGSKKKGIVGIMEISHRHASTLVHDSIMQIANDARMATYKANADIMKGFEWLATLDGNTCIECMAYSGAQWDMKGNSIKGDLPLKNPPLHANCRCVLTSLTKSYRELGLNIDEMPPGTRASDLGQVPSDMSFDAFLKRHDTEYLNDLLGPGRAKLYQEGKITLRQLIDQTGRPLRLDELRKAA